MIFKRLKMGKQVDDQYFDTMYSKPLREASEFHFTPVEIAKFAARELVEHAGTKVLDIGSGAGKFCLVGAACTEGCFIGVEQRENLSDLAEQLAERYAVTNVKFLHGNVADVEFQDYDAFYFFNAFYENITPAEAIDSSIGLQRRLYDDYSLAVREKLNTMPLGTKLVTYFSYSDEVPDTYQVKLKEFDGRLKLWEKVL